MEGLEISIISLNEAKENIDLRIDPEFFERLPPESTHLVWTSIGQCLDRSQYGLSQEMNEDGDGVPIYRMNEISHMLCSETVNKWAKATIQDSEAFALQPRDVLFNRTNSQKFVGRTGIYLPWSDEHRIFASYLVRLKPKASIIEPEYLTAFLNSVRGQKDVKRRARISINQSNVNPEEVKAVRIPILSKSIQSKIVLNFQAAHDLYRQSAHSLRSAETSLEKTFGLGGWEPLEPLTYQLPLQQVTAAGRIDAEYFSPRVTELLLMLGKQGTFIRDIADLRREHFVPVSGRLFSYIEIGDVLSDGSASEAQIDGANAPSRAKWIVSTGDVITSTVRPTRQLSALIRPEQNGYVCSSGFGVLQPRSVPPELLLVYLRLPAIRNLMGLYTTASMYPTISFDDILNLPFLRPTPEVESEIVSNVVWAQQLRVNAEELLERTKQAVDIAIDQSESAALLHLKQHSLH